MATIQQQVEAINAQLDGQKQLIERLRAQRDALPGQLASTVQTEQAQVLAERQQWEAKREDVNVCFRRVKDALHVNVLSMPRSYGEGARPNLERLYELTRDPEAVARSQQKTDEVLRLCGSYMDYIETQIAAIEGASKNRVDQARRDVDKRRQDIDRKIHDAQVKADSVLTGAAGVSLATALERARAASMPSAARCNAWPDASGATVPVLFGYEGPKIHVDKSKANVLKGTFAGLSSGNKLRAACNFNLDEGFLARVVYDVASEDQVAAGIESMLLSALLACPPQGLRVLVADSVHFGPTMLGRLEPLARVKKSGFVRVPASSDELRDMLKRQHARYLGLQAKLAGQTLAHYNAAHPDDRIAPTVVLAVQDAGSAGYGLSGSELPFFAGNARALGITVVELVRVRPEDRSASLRASLLSNADISVQQDATGHFYYVLPNGKKRRFIWNYVRDLPDGFVSRACQLATPKTYGTKYFQRPGFAMAVPTRSQGVRRPIQVPFGIDDDDKVFTCSFEGDNFAAYIMGAAGSGKSTLLHTIIGSLIMNYHPDEVELWLVDFNKTEFSEYARLKPPHVRNLLLEQSEQLMFDLIDELEARMELREKIFEANGWKKLTDVPPAVFMPAIFVIIDEFAQVSKQLFETRSSSTLPDYTLKLESLLRLGRKFGIKFIFASQSFESGIRGLTETAKNQIQVRFAMKNTRDEVEATLGIDGSNRSDELTDDVNTLGRFQSIFRQQETVDGKTVWRYHHVRNLYMEYDELRQAVNNVSGQLKAQNAPSADNARALNGNGVYADKHPVYLTSDAPVPFKAMKAQYAAFAQDVRSHRGYEKVDLGHSMLLHLGVPASFVQVRPAVMDMMAPEENLLVVGGTDDERASVAMSAVRSWRLAGGRLEDVWVWSSERVRAFADHKGHWESLTCACDPQHIKTQVNDVLAKVVADKAPRLVIIFGLDAIMDDIAEEEELAELAGMLDAATGEPSQPGGLDDGGMDLWALMESLDAQIGDGTLDEATRAAVQSQIDGYNEGVPQQAAIASGDGRRVREALAKLMEAGPKRGCHFIVAQPDVYSLKKAGLAQKDFLHKVAFPMGRGDSHDLFGGPLANDLEAGTMAYVCERRQVRTVLRPHIAKGMVLNGWHYDGKTLTRTGGA